MEHCLRGLLALQGLEKAEVGTSRSKETLVPASAALRKQPWTSFTPEDHETPPKENLIPHSNLKP